VNASQPIDERARVERGISVAAACKTAIVEFFVAHRHLPRENAGMPFCLIASDEAVAGIEVRPAEHALEVEIRVTYGSWAGPNNLLVIFGVGNNAGFTYICGAKGTTLPRAWLPASCPAAD
jgi:hypothetical protein